MSSATRCDQIIALIDACLSEVDATPSAPSPLDRSVRLRIADLQAPAA